MQDTLKRRIRFSPPQPLDEKLYLAASDLRIFGAIHRHGPLPTHYLHRFAGYKNLNTTQHRLTQLYNEGYLTRPPEFFESFNARYQFLTYDLGGKGEKLINLSPYIKRGDHMIHRLMGACVGASIELSNPYISRHEILSRNDCKLELPLTDGKLIPDELFGIHKDGKKRFYAVEIDRNTEQLKKRTHRNTIEGKLEGYLEVVERRTYHSVWGIPNFRVLIATTSESRAKAIRERVDPKILDRFTFLVVPEFESPWKMPPVLDLSTLLN